MKKTSELHPIEASHVHARRERFFLLVAGLFLGSLAMLNILGVSRFMVLFSLSEDGHFAWGQWGTISFALAVGVLPYPVTFLCTDIISEFYGRQRANWVVVVGFLINIWVIFILWIGGIMPPAPAINEDGTPDVPIVRIAKDSNPSATHLANRAGQSTDPGKQESDTELERINREYRADVPADYAFYRIRTLAFGAVVASMIAYLFAQFCDVYLFHFWKRITRGKHLWLRNNGSTLVSQLVDTVAVILLTHYFAKGLPIDESEPLFSQLALFIATGYVFKLVVALLDTIPFYLCVRFLSRYLRIDTITDRV